MSELDDLKTHLDDLFNRCLMCKRDKRDPGGEPCSFCKPLPNYPEVAPAGTVFVCGACGKTSANLYGGDDGPLGWDESCMLSATLCRADSVVVIGGRVVGAKPVEGYEVTGGR